MHIRTLTSLAALATVLASTSKAQDSELSSPIHSTKSAQRAAQLPPSAPLVGGADDCPVPDVISGSGPHAFDNSAATISSMVPPDGQSTTNCIFYGQIAIDHDVWFVWTAGATEQVVLDVCGLSTVDTKVAVYSTPLGGPYCPGAGAIALACNDDIDFAGGKAQSRVSWSATAGSEYVIQVGTYTGLAGGTGAFTINTYLPNATCTWDDGTSEGANSVVANPVGSQRVTCWLMRNGAIGAQTAITTVSTVWGRTGTTSPLPAGLIGHVGVFEDPNDDGNPTDGVLLAEASAPMVGQHTDAFQAIPLGTTVVASGYFFVAAWVDHVNGFPAGWDQSSCLGDVGTGNLGLGWLCGNQGATLDTSNLAANSTVPFVLNSANGNLGRRYMVRADCGPAGPYDPSALYCFGDGSGTACACPPSGPGNPSGVGAQEGCANSLVPGVGAKLRVSAPNSNVATIAGDAVGGSNPVTLIGSQMPNSTVLYFQGTQRQNLGNGSAFGDGLRCAGGTVTRLGTKTNAGGTSQYPVGADLPVSVKGLVSVLTPPQTRTYQAWYRNAAAFCTASTFNLSNGAEIVWM